MLGRQSGGALATMWGSIVSAGPPRPPAHGWSGQWVTSSGQHPGAERQPSLWVGGASAFGVPCPPRA